MAVSLAISEIFSVKEWHDLENQVRGRSRSLKMAPFDRPYAIKADRASYRKKVLKSFKGNPKKFYGYTRRMKTVKEKVHQIINRNGH